jgi:hypothetical protein
MQRSKVALAMFLKNYNVKLYKRTIDLIKLARRSFLSKTDGGVVRLGLAKVLY